MGFDKGCDANYVIVAKEFEYADGTKKVKGTFTDVLSLGLDGAEVTKGTVECINILQDDDEKIVTVAGILTKVGDFLSGLNYTEGDTWYSTANITANGDSFYSGFTKTDDDPSTACDLTLNTAFPHNAGGQVTIEQFHV